MPLAAARHVAAQRSCQFGATSDGLPALVAAAPIGALSAGMILFHERVAMSPRGAIGVAGLIVVIIGVVTATGTTTPATP